MKKITSLEGLRGLAALLVLIDHSLLITLERYLKPEEPLFYILSFMGSLGVAVFFILSGYVIFISIDKESTSKFLIRRAMRIYPTIIIATLINFMIQVHYGAISFDLNSIRIFLLNISLFGGAFIYNENFILQIVWTLTVEVQFYMIAAIILFITKGKVDNLIYYSITIALLFLMFVSKLTTLLSDSPFKAYIGVGSTILPFILIGTSLCMLNKKVISNKQFLSILFLIFLAISLSPYPVYYSIDKGLPSYLLAIIMFAVCLYSDRLSHFMSHQVMLFLGKISYPLYAIHISVLNLMKYQPMPGGDSGMFIRIIIFSLLSAYLIHVYIESPVHRWSKQLKTKESSM